MVVVVMASTLVECGTSSGTARLIDVIQVRDTYNETVLSNGRRTNQLLNICLCDSDLAI